MNITDFVIGVFAGILIGMGVIGIFWLRDQKRVEKKIEEFEQKIREVKVQLWLAWGHKEKYEGE